MTQPPASSALATERLAEQVGGGPGRLLEVGSAGIHAPAFALLGWEVVVAEESPERLARARERAGHVAEVVPLADVADPFDVVVAAEPTERLRLLGARVVS